MKFILGTCYRFICFSFWILFSFGFAFLYCNHVSVFFVFFFFVFKVDLKESIYLISNCFFCKYISSSPYISLCLYRYFARVKLVNSCLFEILVFLNLKVSFLFFLFQALVFWKVDWKESSMQICFNIFLFSYMF